MAVANESGNTALHWACLMGHEQVTRLLLEAGANPSALNKWVQQHGERSGGGGWRCSAQWRSNRGASACAAVALAAALCKPKGAPPSSIAHGHAATDAARLEPPALCPRRMEQTPVDEALSRGHQHLMDVINSFSAPAKEVDEVREGRVGKGGVRLQV